MEIVGVYQKQRKEFGRHCDFKLSENGTLIDLQPDPKQLENFIIRDPCSISVQSSPNISSHMTNTETTPLQDKGMRHLEGGWPKDVNNEDPESKKRYLKKMEGEERYSYAIQKIGGVMHSNIKQNLVLDVYEEYFEGIEKTEFLKKKPNAKIVTVLKDPLSKTKNGNVNPRTASSLSFLPTDGSKLAVGFCDLNFSNQVQSSTGRLDSYVWALNNTNAPEYVLTPTSPIVCLDYNPKDSSCIICGCYNGSVCMFDLRSKTNAPVLTSGTKNGHTDPVFDVKWVQSKNSTQFITTSSDGKICTWDITKIVNPTAVKKVILPIETAPIIKKTKAGGGFGKYANVPLNGYSLHYDLNYSATKFMCGTEQGCVITGTKRKNKPMFFDRIFNGHIGPIYSVDRNPFMDKYFLSVGDWCCKVWNEELKEPIMSTAHELSYVTSGKWSLSRPGTFYTTKQDGYLDIWDITFNQNFPVFSLHVSSKGLHTIKPYSGSTLAVGGYDGMASIIELNDSLSGKENGEFKHIREEKEFVKTILDRETKREEVLDQNRKEIKLQTEKDKEKRTIIKVDLMKFDGELKKLLPKKSQVEKLEEDDKKEEGKEEKKDDEEKEEKEEEVEGENKKEEEKEEEGENKKEEDNENKEEGETEVKESEGEDEMNFDDNNFEEDNNDGENGEEEENTEENGEEKESEENGEEKESEENEEEKKGEEEKEEIGTEEEENGEEKKEEEKEEGGTEEKPVDE